MSHKGGKLDDGSKQAKQLSRHGHGGGGHGDLRCCGDANFFCAVNKIPSRDVAVISNRTACGVFDFKPAMFGEKKFLRTLCGVVVYCLTHLIDLPLSSNCQNLFIFVKPPIITLFWKQRRYQICVKR